MNRWQLASMVLMYFLVIGLGIAVAANRHNARKLYHTYQKVESERDQLNHAWARLKLEYGAQLNRVQVEQMAKRNLGMNKPSADRIWVIRE